VQGDAKAEAPAVSLKQVQQGSIYNCYAKPGTQTFLHLAGENTRDLYFRDNFLQHAKEKVQFAPQVNAEFIHGIAE
jgi:hypothetical protein